MVRPLSVVSTSLAITGSLWSLSSDHSNESFIATSWPGAFGMFDDTHLFVAHHPTATSRLGHMCDWRCRNYPLQTCSDICGVIVVINAALAALDQSLFQFLIGPYEKGQVYLQYPSQHGYYLTRILMYWF